MQITGKTSKGALWISKEKTSPYEFYQYFINIDDRDVVKLLKLFTNYEICEIEQLAEDDIRSAKKLLAFEITKLIHGEKDAEEAVKASMALFEGGVDLSSAPTFELSTDEFNQGVKVLDIAVKAKLISSISEGRRMIDQQALSINKEKISDYNLVLNENHFAEGFALLKKGKKSFVKIILN